MKLETVATHVMGEKEYTFHGVELLIAFWAKYICVEEDPDNSRSKLIYIFASKPFWCDIRQGWFIDRSGPDSRCGFVARVLGKINCKNSLEEVT